MNDAEKEIAELRKVLEGLERADQAIQVSIGVMGKHKSRWLNLFPSYRKLVSLHLKLQPLIREIKYRSERKHR